MELKTGSYEIGKRGKYSAGERLVVTMISYEEPVEDDFAVSHAFLKIRLMLLVYYLRNRELPHKLDQQIDFVTLFSPPEEDLKIIEQDYQKIISKIKAGKADELSEGDTMYLGACTKGSTAEKSKVFQKQYAPDRKASKRAFSLKNSYMTTVLNSYIREKFNTLESILNDKSEIEEETFEELILNKINRYHGKTDEELCKEFNVPYKANDVKSLWSNLTYRMLGIKSNKAEEFAKANIEVKTVRIEKNGGITESISFPAIKLKELALTEWEESDLFNDLGSKRFLFVVFKRQGDNYYLKGCQLWNLSREDLDNDVRAGWEAIRKVVNQGVIFCKNPIKNNSGFEIKNNFPKKAGNRIIHIRPHTNNRYYVLEDGEIIGENPVDGDRLPDGRAMTKQGFWFNNNYVISQLDEDLKS